MIEKEDPVISEEEAAQYDRQIRLWGLDAQKRLRGSRVLLAGVRGLGAELAKNLILAGVKGLTLLDHEQVSEESCRAQFLIPVSAQGRNRAQASLERAQNLNPMVEVHADPDRVEDKPDDFFLQFDARGSRAALRSVHMTGHGRPETETSALCAGTPRAPGDEGDKNEKNRKMKDTKTSRNYKREHVTIVTVDVATEHLDVVLRAELVDAHHQIIIQVNSLWTPACPSTVLLKFRTDKGRDPDPKACAEDSRLLRQIRDDVLEAMGLSADLLADDFISYCFSEMSPVCAVVGGVLGQEVVKALSQRDAPHRNFFFFDGRKGNGMVDYFGPN
ncbi:hypothetical protein CCH79_00019157 [Gambusia affinis]|uniref:THIF-type NAD/FAD binding fold domain-containing protein n=1 Tax=Gambusia affinis TaxID=33528 RepID=A0A315UW47_GAMAF|nr:hypothetical protein CCH79_00019157 [Gambusia affinis]